MLSVVHVGRSLGFATLISAFLCGQSKPDQPKPAPNSALVQEFPVTMKENVLAGKTPVGTKVDAKLSIATLFEHTVIPVDATFSGEVVESQAKSATEPSRLAIRMDSVNWKNGSKPIKLYLTAWYYPLRMPTDEDQSKDPMGNPMGRVRSQNPTLHGQVEPEGPMVGPLANVSDTRVVMKDVESTRLSDGGLVLVSSRINLKLNKSTVYVLATGNLSRTK